LADDAENQEMRTAGRIVGPETCAGCHGREARKWKSTRHHGGFRTLNRSDRAAQILGNMDLKSMKKSATCRQCHYTSIVARGRIRPAWGVTCESCHMPASNWVQIHHKVDGRRNGKLLAWGEGRNESAPSRARRLNAVRDAGMTHSLMLYEMVRRCYGCHTVPDETLVNRGGHVDGSGFNLADAFERIRHDFASTGHDESAATRPGDSGSQSPVDVVLAMVDLEMSLRKLAGAQKPGERFHRVALDRARAARARLVSALRQAESPELAAVLKQLPEDLAATPVAATELADKLGDLARRLVDRHGGLKLGRGPS
jgi:hypothetical protein